MCSAHRHFWCASTDVSLFLNMRRFHIGRAAKAYHSVTVHPPFAMWHELLVVSRVKLGSETCLSE